MGPAIASNRSSIIVFPIPTEIADVLARVSDKNGADGPVRDKPIWQEVLDALACGGWVGHHK